MNKEENGKEKVMIGKKHQNLYSRRKTLESKSEKVQACLVARTMKKKDLN